MSGFDPNNPFNPCNYASFNHHHYENHRSSFNDHDYFSKHAEHHQQIQTANNQYHQDNHRRQIHEEYVRAAREQTAQIMRDLDPMLSLSIVQRLKKIFSLG